jgi:hypothetical protein
MKGQVAVTTNNILPLSGSRQIPSLHPVSRPIPQGVEQRKAAMRTSEISAQFTVILTREVYLHSQKHGKEQHAQK